MEEERKKLQKFEYLKNKNGYETKTIFHNFEGLLFSEKYKTQALSIEQIIENLTVLFTVSDSSGDRLQDVLIRARDNRHTNRQFKEYSRGCCRHCTVQDKPSTCSRLGPGQ